MNELKWSRLFWPYLYHLFVYNASIGRSDPEITFWEGIGPNGSAYDEGFTSMAHGWSTGIGPLMTNYVLGIGLQVRVLRPGRFVR